MAKSERVNQLDYATPSPPNRTRFWFVTVAGMVARRVGFAVGCATLAYGIGRAIDDGESVVANNMYSGGFLIGMTVPLGRWLPGRTDA